jgi:hypothetical protein
MLPNYVTNAKGKYFPENFVKQKSSIIPPNASGIAAGRDMAFLKLKKICCLQFIRPPHSLSSALLLAILCCARSYSSILFFKSIRWCKILRISMSPDWAM